MLRLSEGYWQFQSEETLEDFIWENLITLLSLQPLARQYRVKDDICDILALDTAGQLVILELKNTEDRGIVQQLTRYYEALFEEQAFTNQVDYSRGIRLIAIAPSFHRHNWIDRKHHKLNIEFIQFKILCEVQRFHLCLEHPDNQQSFPPLPIPFQLEETAQTLIPLPEPSRVFKNMLSQCNQIEKEGILWLREKLLRADPRMEEISETGRVYFGNGKRYCAEIRYQPEAKIYGQLVKQQATLLLWLPRVVTVKKTAATPTREKWLALGCLIVRVEAIRRMYIYTDWKVVTGLVSLEKGGTPYNATRDASYWETRHQKVNIGHGPLSLYLKLVMDQAEDRSLEIFVDEALKHWRSKVYRTSANSNG